MRLWVAAMLECSNGPRASWKSGDNVLHGPTGPPATTGPSEPAKFTAPTEEDLPAGTTGRDLPATSEDYNFDVSGGMVIMVHRHSRIPDSLDVVTVTPSVKAGIITMTGHAHTQFLTYYARS